MADWESFVGWAERLAASIDVVGAERGYKLAAAQKWAVALDAATSGDDDWPALLKKAPQGSTLINQFASMWLTSMLQERPQDVREAFETLRARGEPSGIDDFAAALASWGTSVTPGNITAFASAVLMSLDPTVYPPYRAQFVTDWAQLVGVEGSKGTPRQRYELLLSLCDRFITDLKGTRAEVGDRLDAQGLAYTVLNQSELDTWAPITQARLAAWRAGDDPDTASVERGEGVEPEMEAAVWEVLGRGLRGETSALAPELTTWTAANTQELRRRIEANPGGGGSFMDKLAGQLRGASDEVVVLLAELLYVRNAAVSDMRADTKIGRVETVLGWGSAPRELPEPLLRVANAASFKAGQGYHNAAPAQLVWLARFVERWVTASAEERRSALADPFAFRAVTASVPDDVATIRYVVEYFAWPRYFPSIVSADHRRRIRDAMIGDVGESVQPSGGDDEAITRDLAALLSAHRRQTGGRAPSRIWYLDPDYRQRWRPEGDMPPRAWLVRPADGGPDLVREWREQGFVSLATKRLPTLDAGSSRIAIKEVVDGEYAHLDESQREAVAFEAYAMLTQMRDDDLMAALDGDSLWVGTLTGPVAYDGGRLTRAVAWGQGALERAELPPPLPSLLDQQGTIVDATAAHDVLEALTGEEADATTVSDDAEAPADDAQPRGGLGPVLAPVTEAVAGALHMDAAPLQEIVDLLQRRGQVVLYGPPGTGKTYVAKRLAEHLVGDPSRVRLVQFHPSFSYEDFFEGYRPVLREGQATFELRDGPLRLLAAEAAGPEHRDDAYVLIIDEMNRANLAKVFGELYFLLEYRDETVRPQYRPQTPFYLPPNLFIIGTMNTADRSIALVDAAIRRRFPFVEMHPSEAPVADVLQRYAVARGVADDRAALLAELNARMGQAGRDLQIGPSYLMRPEIETDADLRLVWRYDILPLLEEHYYGQHDRAAVHDTFGLDALRGAIRARERADSRVDPELPDGGADEQESSEGG